MENRKYSTYFTATQASRAAGLFDRDTEKVKLLELENARLKDDILNYRRSTEQEIRRLAEKIDELSRDPPKRKRRTKQEMLEACTEYNEYKSDGKRKSRPAESIRSYEDFKAIQQYFLSQNRIRDWAMWTIGVCLGLRVSDLLSLKMCDIFNEDNTFKDRIRLVEQKTSKANNCLITEAVVNAVTTYLDSIGWQFEPRDYLFKSKKTKGKMREEYGWKILSDAGKALNLPIIIGSHTMRKSFANIAACVDKSNVDMNAITKIQGLLNHSDQRVTMRYLGTYQKMYDKAREAVSDFVLGKTDVHELVAGTDIGFADIITKLDAIESTIQNTNR